MTTSENSSLMTGPATNYSSRRQQIAIRKSLLPQHALAALQVDRRREGRAIVNKGVKLAVLAARIDAGGQVGQERIVKLTPREIGRQRLCVHAAQDRAKAQGDELARQLRRRPLPEWKD